MVSTQLPKEHVFQESDSFTCGPSCMAMVYAMKGKNITAEDILKDFGHPQKGKPSWVPQLATHFEKNGIKTKIFISTSQLASPSWKDLSKEKLINNLTKWQMSHKKHAWRKGVEFLIEYLKAGGDIELKSYTAQTIKAMIDRGSLVILCIDEDWVWGHRFKQVEGKRVVDDIEGQLEGHFVLVTEYKDNTFHVLDPFPTNLENRHGVYDIDMDQLTNASLTWDAEVIEVLK